MDRNTCNIIKIKTETAFDDIKDYSFKQIGENTILMDILSDFSAIEEEIMDIKLEKQEYNCNEECVNVEREFVDVEQINRIDSEHDYCKVSERFTDEIEFLSDPLDVSTNSTVIKSNLGRTRSATKLLNQGLVRVAPLKNVPKIIKTKIQFQNGISVDENDENFRREEIISDLNPFPELVFDVTEENRCKNTCDYDNSMKNIEEIDIKIENIIGSNESSNYLDYKLLKVKKYECENCAEAFQVDILDQQVFEAMSSSEKKICKECSGIDETVLNKLLSNYGIKPKLLRCENCLEGFTDAKKFKTHKQPLKTPLKCVTCSEIFLTNCSYELHKAMHTGDQAYRCKVCLKGFLRAWHLVLHNREHIHQDDATTQLKKIFLCDKCPKAFEDVEALKLHKQVTHRYKKHYTCGECITNKLIFDSLEKHAAHHKGRIVFKLKDNVDNSFVNKQSLKCDVCNEKVSSPAVWKKHLFLHMREGLNKKPKYIREVPRKRQEYTCRMCAKKFVSYSHYLSHEQNHVNPLQCDVCDRSFEYKAVLESHKLEHVNQKIYKCPSCPEIFFKLTDFKLHKLSHPIPRPYSCDICKRKFISVSQLETHVEIHTKEKLHRCKECPKSFTKYSYLLKHNLVHSTVRPHKCAVCSKGFKFFNELETHKLKHTGERPYKCDRCPKAFVRITDLKNHIAKLHDKIILKCEACSETFARESELNLHRLAHPELKPLHKCETCSRTFKAKTSLIDHRSIHTGSRPHKCKLCSKAFRLKSHLQRHRLVHVKEKRFLCEQCPQRFKSIESLRLHVKRHDEITNFKCATCGETFQDLPQLIVHKRTHFIKPLKCDYCQRTFQHLFALNIHVRTHTGEKPYKCDLCPKSYTSKSNLLKHKLIHTGIKPYKCATCSKRYIHRETYKEHLRLHTGEKPYMCDKCPLKFSQRNSLNRHLASHVVGFPFKCAECSKMYKNLKSLEVHKRVHTGERPFKCELCSKSYADKNAFTYHKLLHSGVRAYKCKLCLMRFRSSWHLKTHVRVHTGEKPFKCKYCGKGLATSNSLKQHELRHEKSKKKGKQTRTIESDDSESSDNEFS